MRPSPAISGILILSLVGIVLCGMMPCLELLTHYSVLAGSIPMAPVIALLFWCIASAIVIASIASSILGTISISSFHSGPDPALWRPLQTAFSDGILNTKVF